MDVPIYSFLYLIVCGITSLVLWIKMMSIIDSKGLNTSYSFIRIGQYVTFWRLIKDEQDERNKKKYRRLFWIQIGLVPVYQVGFFLLLPFD